MEDKSFIFLDCIKIRYLRNLRESYANLEDTVDKVTGFQKEVDNLASVVVD